MQENTPNYRCYVCGLEGLEPPWGEDNCSPLHIICPCCGCEFGYEDSTPHSTKAYREKWLSNGAKWFRPKEKPENWDLQEQLSHIPPFHDCYVVEIS
jgi:hypothetical protein